MMNKHILLEDKVAAVGDLPYFELVEHWAKAHGCPPPKGVKRGLLERSAAYVVQTKHLGGLSPSARRMLRAALKQYELGRVPPKLRTEHENLQQPAKRATRPLFVSPAEVPVGSRLLREWQGQIHSVDVVDGGFRFRGELQIALGDRPQHHRRAMVGTKVLWPMSANGKRLRCAIYTRKSSEEGLEQEFNSLDAASGHAADPTA